MDLSEIELARVRKALDAFMAKRRPPVHIREKLDLGSRISGQSVEIFEVRPAWHGYESALEVDSIEEFCALVDEDAYACFFG